jgi:hypothetical protein
MVEVVDGVYADVPSEWSLDRTTSPVVMGVPGSNAAIQASWVAHPAHREPTVASARTAALSGVSFLQKKMGWKFVEARTQERETEDGSAAVWLDVSPGDEGDSRRFSVGRREWKDGSLVLTWIGDDSDGESRDAARRAFDGARRAGTT